MLIAVHPDNNSLIHKEYPCVFNQGQLILALTREPTKEVLIDKDLPGHLRLDDLLQVIATKFPDAQVSVIEKESNSLPHRPSNFIGKINSPRLIIISFFLAFILIIFLQWAFNFGRAQSEYIIFYAGLLIIGIYLTVIIFTFGGISFKCKKEQKSL